MILTINIYIYLENSFYSTVGNYMMYVIDASILYTHNFSYK